MSWNVRKKPQRERPSNLPENIEKEVYQYICDNVPFVTMKQVAAHFAAKYNYAPQHLYVVMRRLRKRGFIKRSVCGNIALQRFAPVLWGDDSG